MKSRILFLQLALVIFSFSSFAQYKFDSKKAEKLYYQLEEYYAIADYQSILDNQSNIEKYYLNKTDTLAALMNSFLGESYLAWEGDVPTSLDYYQKELELRKELQPGEDFRDLIFNLAVLYAEMNQYDEAEALYTDLLKDDEKQSGKKSDEYLKTSLGLLDFYINTYQVDKGDALLKDIKKLTKKNTYEEALALRGEAEIRTQQGELKRAERSITEAIEILEETGYYPSLEYVYFLNTMSFVYSDMGKLAIVEEILRNSLDILDRLQGDYEEDEITIKSNLATLYREMGLYDQSKDLFLEVRDFDAEYYGEDSYSYAISTYSLGLNSYYAQKFLDAIDYMEVSLALFESLMGTDDANYARNASTLVAAYTMAEEYEMAQALNDKALDAYKNAFSDDNAEYAYGLSNAALMYQHLNKLDEAEKLRDEEVALRRKTLGETHPLYGYSLKRMAVVQWQKKDFDKTKDLYLRTFDNYFAQINSFFPVLSEEEKSKFYYNNLKPTFEQFNTFIVNNKSLDSELIELMYNYQLSTKGLILYATNKVRESIVNSGDSLLLGKYETWIAQKERLAQLFSSGDLDPDVRTAKIDSLTEINNELEAELSSSSAAFAANFAGRDLTWKDVQEKLKPGEAAIEIVRFRDFNPQFSGSFTDEVFYAALIVTPDTQEAPELVIMRNGAQMENRYLSNYRNAIKYRISENYSYRLFWEPIAKKLGPEIKKLYFSPDGVYNQISIYTLRNPETKNYTIDEIEIQLVTNTKDLIAANYEQKSDFSQQSSILFGYPDYNMGKVEEQGGETEAGEGGEEDRGMRGVARGARGARGDRGGSIDDLKELSRGGIPRGLRGNMFRYMRSNSLLSLLPGTLKEVNLIDSLYDSKQVQTTVFLDENAVEDQIKSIDNPKTLHIATHGFFLPQEDANEFGEMDKHVENPLLRSGLILAGANSYIRYGEIGADKELKDDGILTAYEAMNLNLDDTELVILSACETGLGEVKNGEGVFGLQRAFKVAGADAVIMSMWTVDDNATQELMTNFYEEWLSSGNKQQAFVTAQKRLKDKWKQPYFWGAFVMVGN